MGQRPPVLYAGRGRTLEQLEREFAANADERRGGGGSDHWVGGGERGGGRDRSDGGDILYTRA